MIGAIEVITGSEAPYKPGSGAEYYGRQMGRDLTTLAGGAAVVDGTKNAGTGLAIMGGAALAEAASGGLGTPVAGPAAAGGAGLTLAGITEMAAGGLVVANSMGLDPVPKPEAPGGPSAKDIKEQTPQERGRQNEQKILDKKGETKNTEKVSGTEGNSVPDYQNETQIGEIKDTKRVTDSKQMRTQREAAAAQGKEHVVDTGTKTEVSKTVQKQSTVVRHDEIGPQ